MRNMRNRLLYPLSLSAVRILGLTRFFWDIVNELQLIDPCPGFAQAGSPLLTLITIFGRLLRSLPNHFNSG